MFSALFLLCLVGLSTQQYDIDCDNINPDAKAFVDAGINSGKLVFMVSKTTCPYCDRAKQTFTDIGFHEDDLNIVEVDDLPIKSDIQDYNWCLTGGRTFPRVWADGNVVGGSDNTKEGYWSGELVKLAYESRLRRAAKDFVDTAVERTDNHKYFIISKTTCSYCYLAKNCLKRLGVDEKDIHVVEIQDYETHDQIKAYAGEITGASSTPRIWYNKTLIGGYTDLKAWSGC